MNDANHENPLISFKDSCKNFLHESLNDSLSLARFCSRSDANYQGCHIGKTEASVSKNGRFWNSFTHEMCNEIHS